MSGLRYKIQFVGSRAPEFEAKAVLASGGRGHLSPGGRLVAPDIEYIGGRVPHIWRKAWAAANYAFCYDKFAPEKPAWLHLHSVKTGAHLGYVQATPLWEVGK